MSLGSLFSPRGVAIVGASDNPKKFGGLCLENLIKSGYQGSIVPVNPTKPSVMGVRAYPRVRDIDCPVDVVAVAVPKNAVRDVVLDCGKLGIPYLMVMSGGYSETGAEGKKDERALIELAHENGVRIIGPNLLGLASTPVKLLLNASLAMREVEPREGGVSLVSQSGAAMGVIYNRGAREGVRFRHVIALGNQADIEIADVVMFYAEDPGTRVVITSVEGLKNPARFIAAAEACAAANKPLLLVKSGRTTEGAKVAATHTGSMASDYNGFAAKCEELGVVLVQDELTMMRLGAMYDLYGDAPARNGIALASPSGGAIAQMTDRISERGMRLAKFGPETVKKLETIYVPGLTDNPLDFANMHDNSFVDVGDGGTGFIVDDNDVGAVVGVLGTVHNPAEMVTGMARPVGHRKPLLFTMLPGGNADPGRKAASDMRHIVTDSIDDTLDVLQMWFKGRPKVHGAPARPDGIASVNIGSPAGDMLGEFEAKQLLSSYGIPVTRESKANDVEDAVRQATAIGFPVVLKGFGSQLVHKSEFGAVKLHLRDEAAVRQAWSEIQGSVGAGLEGCVVAEMVKGEVEVILGAFRSPEFGPMVMFGAGGILAELLHDVAILPAPAHPDAIRDKLNGLKIAKLLHGFRGKPACDIDALVDAIWRLGFFAADLDSQIDGLDINPLIVRARGQGVVAVDARIGVRRDSKIEGAS